MNDYDNPNESLGSPTWFHEIEKDQVKIVSNLKKLKLKDETFIEMGSGVFVSPGLWKRFSDAVD